MIVQTMQCYSMGYTMTDGSPAYLMTRNGIYYFQTRIPSDSVHNNGGKQGLIRRSTRTGNRREALKIARIWWVEIMSDNTNEEIEASAERFEKLYSLGKHHFHELGKIDQDDLQAIDEFQEDWTEFDKKAINYYQDRKALREKQEKQAAHQQLNPAPHTSAVPQSAKEVPEKLSTLLDKYMKVNAKKSKTWTKKTAKTFKAHITLFIQMLGDPYVHDLTEPMVRDKFGDLICDLPIRMNLTKKYFNGGICKLENRKPIDKIITITNKDGDKTLDPKTIVDYVNVVRGFLTWLSKKAYTDHNMGNVLEELSELAKNQEEKENRFPAEDLKKLFETDDYRDGLLMEYPERHWAPLIGLFTGAREGEICQLNLDDVNYDNECKTWVIEFKPGGDKRLKNKYSARVTPVHDSLIDLGLLVYVNQLKEAGETRLFPREIPASDGSWGRKVSRWFNGELVYGKKDKGGKKTRKYKDGYKDKCGIIQADNERKNFHSFRHTLINHGHQNDFDDKVLREITGHTTHRKDDHENYKSSYILAKRKDVIARINFDIDINAIKKWL